MSRSDPRARSDQMVVEIADGTNESVLTLKGIIDEESDFSRLNGAKSKNLIFDLGGVQLINSVGIRSWVNWMKANREHNFTFRNCSKPITDQINVLDGFLPKGSSLESFYVPFFCESCDKGIDVLYRRGIEFVQATADKPSEVRPPKVKCDSCGREMSPDVLEAKYFRFLKYR